ncbi:TPA: FAD/NAD(P)-binding oxidoreductase [Candidatus Bipolaricaulota bacterium]|nr:FAD/NAD(P)-binding oxidoreductase [Candidatus Bipolaricaulota bacterium]
MRIAVVGAGIVGALIAREICRFQVEVLLFERAPDVGWGVTKANSGIVHGGFHDEPGTLRARFCAPGNALFGELSRELDFPFRRTGAWVLAFSRAELSVLEKLREQGEENGAPGLEILPRTEVLAREPHVNTQVVAGLWSPTVGITEPWEIAIAAVENARENGLQLHLAEPVIGIELAGGRVMGVRTPRGVYPVDAVVNAAGLHADRVARMAGLREPQLFPRRGEYVLLDKAASGLVNSVLFPAPRGESKGILVLPTVDGGVLLGPTAADLPEGAREATETTASGLAQVAEGARRLIPELPLRHLIKTFAGLRPESPERDFLLGPTPIEGFYQAAAMRSPGLTAAPAIARWLAHEVIAPELGLARKDQFNPFRRGIPHPAELPPGEWEALIREDPCWGRLVCFCNRVTEGEIVEAIRRGARTLDGIKFRTRAGFGRCQGGFCTDKILQILSRELGVPPEGISQHGPGSPLVVGRVRP